MGIRIVIGAVFTTLVISGCGGAADYAAKSSYAGSGGSGASYVTADAPAAMEAQSSTHGGGASTNDSSRHEALNPTTPTERPGLGTGWGESRTSHVHEVAFERDGTSP